MTFPVAVSGFIRNKRERQEHNNDIAAEFGLVILKFIHNPFLFLWKFKSEKHCDSCFYYEKYSAHFQKWYIPGWETAFLDW